MASSLVASSKLSAPLRTISLFRTLSLSPFSTTTNDAPADVITVADDHPDTAAADVDDAHTSEEPASSDPQLRREGLDEVICRMMAKRPWTTRLQNSIRSLCPSFDAPLVLSILHKSRSPEHALTFFRFVERKASFRHDRLTYKKILLILTDASMLNHARCILLDDIPKRSVPYEESMFLPLIRAYGAAGIPQESVKIFRKMPDLGVPHTLRSYEVFFKAILRRGRGMMAKRVFNAMLREGIEPTVFTYNIMIWGFCLSEMTQTAMRFLAEMKERGVVPDVVTYNTLIGGWVRGKNMDNAKKMFDEMCEAGLKPNSISYTSMIKGYVQEENVQEGLRLFREMEEKGVSASEKTYCVLLPGLCGDPGKVGEAKNMLEMMAEKHIRPQEEAVFLNLVASLCESGRAEEAVEVLRLVDRFRLSVDSTCYNVLMESFCKGGVHHKAVDMVDEVLNRGVLLAPSSSVFDPAAYNPVIAHMCQNGLAKKAETFFRQLMKKGVDDALPFNHLIQGHSREGSPESALELLTIMKNRNIASDPDALVSLIESFLRKGEPADAKAALDTMMEHGHLPSSTLFRSVIESLLENDRIQTASRAMKSMIEKGVKDHMDIVHKILETLFIRGHVEEAVGRINLMLENDCFPEIDRLLTMLCEKGKIIAALKLADFALERNCDISFESYDRVLDALYSNGKTLNAYSLLCKIKNKGGHTNKKAAAALVRSLIEEGNTKQADILSRLIFPKVRRGSSSTASAA